MISGPSTSTSINEPLTHSMQVLSKSKSKEHLASKLNRLQKNQLGISPIKISHCIKDCLIQKGLKLQLVTATTTGNW